MRFSVAPFFMKLNQILMIGAIYSLINGLSVQAQLSSYRHVGNYGDIHTAQRLIRERIDILVSKPQVVKECGIDLNIHRLEVVQEGIAHNPEYPILGEITYELSFFPRGSHINPNYCASTLKNLLSFPFNGTYLNPIGAESLGTPNFYQIRFVVPAAPDNSN